MDPVVALESIPGIGPYVPYITFAVTVATAAIALLPAPADTAPTWWKAVYGTIHVVANFKTPPAAGTK